MRTLDGEVLLGVDGAPVLEPIGSFVDDRSDKEVRREISYLAAMPSMVLQAAERVESTEWWSAVKRRKTNLGKRLPPGQMPWFRSARRDDQAFVCWYNGATNAVYTKTGRKSGMVTIRGENPSGKYGPGEKVLAWRITVHFRHTQPIRSYTSVRVNLSKLKN